MLDFGLAKLTEKQPQADVDKEAATLAKVTTDPGAVMGTPQYMSPEQARGQRVDARTDIFSFGIVLYEMLAGQPPFTGVNVVDVLAAILEREPAPLAEVPAELQRVVSQMLCKDRAQRYANSQNLLRELKEIKEELAFAAKLSRNAERGMRSAESTAAVQPTAVTNETPPASTNPSVQFRIPHTALRIGVPLAVLVLAVITAYFFINRRSQPALAEREPLLLADFENKTGEEIWDGTLKQALAVALEQSPYMNIFPEERARDTLRLMNRLVDEPITRAVGREICQRRNVRALLIGTIAKLERSYTVTLEATNAQSGERMALALEQAAGRDEVVNALERAATSLRGKLGESLASLQKYDKPLEEATTTSLDALKAYSEGRALTRKGAQEEAIPFFQRATELDPGFASAWRILGTAYLNSGNPGKGREYLEQAWQLRERSSEREKLFIATGYFWDVGDLNKMNEQASLWMHLYPQEASGFYQKGSTLFLTGQYEKALEAFREAIRIDPDSTELHRSVATSLLQLDRYDEATAVIKQAQARKLDMWPLHLYSYQIAFVRNDAETMRREVEWFPGKLQAYRMPEYQARAAAFGGRLRQAHDFWQRASALAASRNLPVEMAGMQAWEAEIKAQFGLAQPAVTQASQAVALLRNRNAETFWRRANLSYPLNGQLLALTFALSGDTARAQARADELAQKLPEHTLNNGVWLPTIRAALELKRNQPDKAIQLLETARQYDSAYTIHFRSAWLRGQAYLQLKQGAQAAAEFQKIIDHRGWDVTSPLWPLAHLGLARAALLQGEAAKAKQMYDEFFRLWKDADADLPVLIEAKKEYVKLK